MLLQKLQKRVDGTNAPEPDKLPAVTQTQPFNLTPSKPKPQPVEEEQYKIEALPVPKTSYAAAEKLQKKLETIKQVLSVV